MDSRCVTHVRRNADGDITALCNPGEPWSPREKEDVIKDLEHKRPEYEYYLLYNGKKVGIHVVHRENGPYLRTVHDEIEEDGLGYMPECHDREHAVR